MHFWLPPAHASAPAPASAAPKKGLDNAQATGAASSVRQAKMDAKYEARAAAKAAKAAAKAESAADED